jgi:uncharacterized glyoxalase superfamily protein PhnB
LIVERIEPVLDLWERQLGFNRKAAVPGEDGELVFALFERGPIEVMLQTARSLDLPRAVRTPSALLYIDVDSIDETLRELKGVEVVKEPHATFYGTRELSVRDPSGQILGFAEHLPAGAAS